MAFNKAPVSSQPDKVAASYHVSKRWKKQPPQRPQRMTKNNHHHHHHHHRLKKAKITHCAVLLLLTPPIPCLQIDSCPQAWLHLIDLWFLLKPTDLARFSGCFSVFRAKMWVKVKAEPIPLGDVPTPGDSGKWSWKGSLWKWDNLDGHCGATQLILPNMNRLLCCKHLQTNLTAQHKFEAFQSNTQQTSAHSEHMQPQNVKLSGLCGFLLLHAFFFLESAVIDQGHPFSMMPFKVTSSLWLWFVV